MSNPHFESCLRIKGDLKDLDAHEIYKQVLDQTEINVLGIYAASKRLSIENNKDNLSAHISFSRVEELTIKPNRHLVTNLPKLKLGHFQMIDTKLMESYEREPGKFSVLGSKRFSTIRGEQKVGGSSKGKFYEESKDGQKENQSGLLDFIENLTKPEKEEEMDPSSCVILIYDKPEKIDKFRIQDILIKGKPVSSCKTILPEYYIKKLFYSEKNLYFTGKHLTYEDFEVGVIQNYSHDPDLPLFRRYWTLANLEDYGCKVDFKNIYFHTSNPLDAQLPELLTLDLVFYVQNELEMRFSFDFEYIQTYSSEDTVEWMIQVVRHPVCYFYSLKPYEHLAFHVKKWRRIPNFLLGAMSDNIERLYLATKNIIRLVFKKDSYQKTQFFSKYEKKLKEFARLVQVQPKFYKCVNYTYIPLNLNTQRMNQARVPFNIKFLIMIMVSRGQVNVYDLPENFLEKICNTANDNIRLDMVKLALEMIIFNKDYDNNFMLYKDFKEALNKCIKLVKYKEKILDSYKANNINTYSFDANLYSFELHITPSCIYYLAGELGLSKTILYNYPDHVERFLQIRFVDENLEVLKLVRSVLANLYYFEFLQKIEVFDRHYEFLSFGSSQIESRSFWTFYSTEKVKGEKILESIELGTYVDKGLNDMNLIDYATKVSDQLKHSYDTINVKTDKIKVSKIPIDHAINRNVTIHCENVGLGLRKFTYEGLISADILDEISVKFNYGEIPGLILRASGQDFLVLKDSEFGEKSIRFYEDVFNQQNLRNVAQFEIVEIPRYRPAFLNRPLILLLEKTFAKDYPDEFEGLKKGIQTALIKFLEKLTNNDLEIFRRVVFGSKYPHTVLQPVFDCYKDFPEDLYFSQLIKSIKVKSNLELFRNLKISSEFGARLLGIIDDTGTLKQNEIYYDIENPLGKLSYKENNFPFVLIARKPYMNSSDNDSDIRYFKINRLRFTRNAYKELKNCIVFSKDDMDFVLNSCTNINKISRTNYFLVFWDMKFVPERYKTIQPSKPNIQFRSQDNFNRNESKSLTLEMPVENKFENSTSMFYLKFNKFKTRMMSTFISLIRNPRMKDIKILHLAYFDVSKSKLDYEIVGLLADCYRQMNVHSPLKELKDSNQVHSLLNVLESSRYLAVPFYYTEIKSFHTTISRSLLWKIYEDITKSLFYRSELDFQENNQKILSIEINKDLIYPGYEKYLKHGLKVLILYKYDIQRLCFLYGCSCESDLFIGFNKRGDLYAKDVLPQNFYKEFINLKDYIRILVKKYRQLFHLNLKYITVDGKKKLDPNHVGQALSKASAWYICSLYCLWSRDNTFANLLKDKELEPLLNVLNIFDLKGTYGLPWVVASPFLTEIMQMKKTSNKS